LASIPHKKFIFLSSVDVYPKKDQGLHSEDEVIDLNSVENIYGVMKLMTEAVVRNNAHDFLILRASALLGKYSRRNSLIKMLEDDNCSLTLSGASSFNYVLHLDVIDFIILSIRQNITGIYNIASSKNIMLFEIAEILNKEVKFGSYRYKVCNINNRKISSLFPAFKKTSMEALSDFIRSRNE